MQRLLKVKPTEEANRFAHDFSQISVHPKSLGTIQAKLTVNPPGDIYEQEADRVSEQVMRMPEPAREHACACGGLRSECQSQQPDQQNVLLQTKRFGPIDLEQAAVPPIVHEVFRSPGQPLDLAARAFMERRFGHDFSHVRVHTNAKAADSAQAVKALAYTMGRDVVFGVGQYSPTTTTGRQLIAHELTHVVQQSGSSLHAGSPHIGSRNDPAETEADSAARAIETATSRIHSGTPGSQIPRCVVQRSVRPENVTCHQTGLRNPNLTGDEAVAAITDADADAIVLAQEAETRLTEQLAAARAGDPIDAGIDTILREELGLTFTNRAHFGLTQREIIDRFHRVRETLESGYLRYMCRGGEAVPLVGCTPARCGTNFASSCPGNRLIVLCQPFWDIPDQQSATILHEPFHVWFHMARHAPNALRRADASCFESFALRVSGRDAFASCVDHTAG